MRWLRVQWFSLVNGLRVWSDSPFNHFMNLFVLAFALGFPWVVYNAITAMTPSIQRWVGDPEVNVFFYVGSPSSMVNTAVSTISESPFVNRVRVITPAKAAEIMKQLHQSNDVLEALPSNPLPHTIAVQLNMKDQGAESRELEEHVMQWRHLEGVESVQFDVALIRRVQSIASSFRWAGIALAMLVAVMVVIVTFNTVRLQMIAHVDEISVWKALGATDAQVGRPVMWWAFSMAIVAFGLANVALLVSVGQSETTIGEWLRQFDPQFSFTQPNHEILVTVLSVWTLLVMTAAWLSVRQVVWKIR